MRLRAWEIILLVLAILSVTFLIIARTVGSQAASRTDAVTRVIHPGIVFWGEVVDVEVRIEANSLPTCPAVGKVEPIYVALVIDRSGSMSGLPIAEARNAASDFVDLMNLVEDGTGDAVTVVVFDDDAELVEPFSFERYQAAQSIQNIRDGGGTNIAAGLILASEQFANKVLPVNARPIIILLSDGQSDPNAAIVAADQAKSQNIHLATIALGDADRDTLARIASSEADYYEATDPTTLLDIYSEIAEGLVGSVATNVILEEYYDDAHFELAGGLYRAQKDRDSSGQIIWQLPFVGQKGRSVGYFLEPTMLGWYRVSPTPGQMSLTDCNGQPLMQVTPIGPRVLVLFPVWLLYIAPILALLWFLYRLIKWLRRAKPKPVVTRPKSRPVIRKAERPTRAPTVGSLTDWYPDPDKITDEYGRAISLRVGGQSPEEIQNALQSNKPASVRIRVDADKENREVGYVNMTIESKEKTDLISGTTDKWRDMHLENFSADRSKTGELVLDKAEALAQQHNVRNIYGPLPKSKLRPIFESKGYQIHQDKQEVSKSLEESP